MVGAMVVVVVTAVVAAVRWQCCGGDGCRSGDGGDGGFVNLSEFMRRCVGEPWQKMGVKKRYFCPASISSFDFTRRPVTSGLVRC